MDKKSKVAEVGMGYYTTAMVFAIKDNSRIIWDTVMVSSNSIKYKYTGEIGKLMNFLGKGN